MAANVVGMNIMGFVMIPGNALTISLMVMVGQRVGRGDIDDITRTALFSSAVAAVFMLAMSFVMLPMAGLMESAFGLNPDSARYFRQLYLSLLVGGPLFWPLSFVVPSALRAVKDVTYTMSIAIITMLLFRLGVGYFFGIVMGLGALGVWLGIYSEWAARSCLFLTRLLRKKWKQRLLAKT